MDDEKVSAAVICHSVGVNPRSITHSNGSRFLLWVYMLRGGAIQYKSRQHLFISLQMEGIFTHKADVITLEESPLMSYVLLTLCNILKLLKLKHGNRLVFLWIPFKQDGFCLSNGIILQGVMFFMTAKHYLLVQLQKSVWSYLYLTIISRSLILSCLVYSS